MASLVLAASVIGASCSLVGNKPGYKVTAQFPRAVSLYRSSTVRVLGLAAGRVTSIKTAGTVVTVTMSIDKDINLPPGVQAAIVPQSLIGERYVQLYPAWTEGQPKVAPGEVIGLDRTSIPVEPDEALAALKQFLDSLDPHATGKLVHNLADDLQGNGQRLNDALAGLGRLSTTLADKDQQLADIIDHFDKLTSTLRTREAALGKVLDEFATATGLLAAERQDIQGLVQGLATLSRDGLQLVTDHSAQLDHDLTVLTNLLESVNANMDSVRALLDSAPTLVAGSDLTGTTSGLTAAYDPKYHHLDLRNAASPTVAQLLNAIGLPASSVCLPLDVACTPAPAPVPVPPPLPAIGSAQAAAPPTTIPLPSVTPPSSIVPPVVPTTTSTTTPPTTITLLPPVSLPTSPILSVMRLMGSPGTPGADSGKGALTLAANDRPSGHRRSLMGRVAAAVLRVMP
jgi:virulence factor Mce-like protein